MPAAASVTRRASLPSLPGFLNLTETFTFERLSAALLFVAIACAACLMPAQNDTWWHLREGEVLWRGGAALTDQFSHTVFGGHWQNREWLAQVLFYLLFRLGGLPLLTLVLAAFVTGAWYVSWHLMEGRTTQRVVLVGLALTTSSIEWCLRPQVFTLFFVSVTALLVSKRLLWPLPLVFLVWANLHGGVIIGYGLLGVAVACSLMQDSFRKALGTAAAAVIAFLATGLTPIGAALWTESLGAARRMHEARISEFQPSRLDDPILLPFWLLTAALGALVIAARPWRRESPARGFIVMSAVALVPVALVASRNTPVMLLLAVPAIHQLIGDRISARNTSRPRRERPLLNVAVLVVAIVVAVTTVGSAWARPATRLGWDPMPAGAAETIASCHPNLYNRFDEGGFLIWFARSQKVFIDSRFDPYPMELIREHVRVEASGDYADLFQRFRIHCAVVHPDSVLARRLSGDGWRTIYDRAGWLVLESREP
jgi:hypothetical protein